MAKIVQLRLGQDAFLLDRVVVARWNSELGRSTRETWRRVVLVYRYVDDKKRVVCNAFAAAADLGLV